MTKLHFAVAALAALAASQAPSSTALAATVAGDTMTVSVDTADLDASTPDGQKVLKQRIAAAASRLCQRLDPNATLAMKSACVAKATAGTYERIALKGTSAKVAAR